MHFNADKPTHNLSRDSWKSHDVRHGFCRAVFLFLHKVDFWVLQSLVNIFISRTDFVKKKKNQISLGTDMISLLPRAKYQPWTLIHGYLIWDVHNVNIENAHGFCMRTDFTGATGAPPRGPRRHRRWRMHARGVAPQSKSDSQHEKGSRKCPSEPWAAVLRPWRLCAGWWALPSHRAA